MMIKKYPSRRFQLLRACYLFVFTLATFSMSNVSFSMKTNFSMEEDFEIKIEIKQEKKKKIKKIEDIVATEFNIYRVDAIKKRNRILRNNKILGALCWPCLPCLSCFPGLFCCK